MASVRALFELPARIFIALATRSMYRMRGRRRRRPANHTVIWRTRHGQASHGQTHNGAVLPGGSSIWQDGFRRAPHVALVAKFGLLQKLQSEWISSCDKTK